jgi:HEAT repeat protein
MRTLEGVSTERLLERAASSARRDSSRESDERWGVIRELHRRGYVSILEAAARWSTSTEGLLRCLAADVLGQLGFAASYPYAAESAPILVALLEDTDDDVVACALVALGHLGVGDADVIARLGGHESADIRSSVAYCLGKRDETAARESLVALSVDSDSAVRNWATFGLGALSEVDCATIREALVARLSDSEDEVRGEAMLGLATRGDARAIPAILEELERDQVMDLAIEAAGILANAAFLPALEALLEAHPDSSDIRVAVERCRST